MKRIALMILLGMFLCVSTAQAKEKTKGNYFSGNIGLSILTDSDLSVTGTTFSTVSFDPGLNIGVALGHDFGDLRAEGEIMYRGWNMDTLTVPGTVGGVAISGCPCTGSVEGDASSLSFMANGYYDLSLTNSSLEPYVGGGIGFSSVNAEINVLGDDTDIVFAYQFMAGVGYPISPSTSLTAGYRFFGTTSPEFQVLGIPVEAEIQSHDFNIGFRVSF